MFRRAAAVAFILAIRATAGAQQPLTAQDSDLVTLRSAMARATKAYQEFNVERAVPLLEMVVARRDIVPTAELAPAYKLLGAAQAVLGKHDRARESFMEALRLDPQTTLDPVKFSATEIAAFNDARRTMTPSTPAESAAARLRENRDGRIRIGTMTPEAFFYVDNAVQGPISSMSSWTVPAGRPVRITIRSAKCAVPWDSVVTVAPGSTQMIGRRMPSNCR